MDSWRNPPSPWRKRRPEEGSAFGARLEAGASGGTEYGMEYLSRRSTGQGVKPITGGVPGPSETTITAPRGLSSQRIGSQPEGLSGCCHPKKIPKTLRIVQDGPSAAQSQEANKSPGRVANVGDGGRPWKTVQTGEIGLITRRSKVQILPPPPTKVQVRAGPRTGPSAAGTESHRPSQKRG